MTDLATDIGFQVQSAMVQADDYLQTQKTTIDFAKHKKSTEQQIEEKAKEFEAVFLTEMLKPMFENIETNGIFGGGHAEKVYRSMMVKEYGDIITEAGGIGIAEIVKKEMIEMQARIDHQKYNNVPNNGVAAAETSIERYNAAQKLNVIETQQETADESTVE